MKIGKFFSSFFGRQKIEKNTDPKIKCKNIASSLKRLKSWQWDERFGVVLAEFGTEDEDKILSVLDKHFCESWDEYSIETAPIHVLNLADYLGGIDGDQILFTTAQENETFIFCAWWPWGNGQKISIRIAPFPTGDESFKSCFGL